jgi:hypothetical protein
LPDFTDDGRSRLVLGSFHRGKFVVGSRRYRSGFCNGLVWERPLQLLHSINLKARQQIAVTGAFIYEKVFRSVDFVDGLSGSVGMRSRTCWEPAGSQFKHFAFTVCHGLANASASD